MRLRDQRITEHFRWVEFYDRHTGRPPPMPSRRGVRRLVAVLLEPMRAELGACHVWSGYRTAATNRMVGGAPRSHHVYDWWPESPAADITFAEHGVHEWAALAEHLHVGGMGIYPTHLHVDLRTLKARW